MKQNNPKFLKEIKHNQELFKAIKKRGKKKDWIKNRIQLDSEQRISICNESDKLTKVTRQCKICFCFMDLKTKMKNKYCPQGKW